MSLSTAKIWLRKSLATIALLTLVSPMSMVQAQEGAELAELAVYPPDINLETARDLQSFVVQATFANKITKDVTTEAKVTLSNATVAKLEGNVLLPIEDGTAEMTVEYGGKKVVLKVNCKDAKKDRPISFKLDVMPVFAKSGCNTGSCHGAARGKDGFRLSLFGFDPEGDHDRLTRQIPGRRINLASLHDSLVLEKASGRVPHSGGKRFEENGELYNTILRWLEAGAPLDGADVATPTALEIFPPGGVLDGDKATQQMIARAKYSDGTDRDVTSLVFFMSNNETSAQISQEGSLDAGERGEAFLMARFATFTVGSHFVVLPEGFQFEFPKIPEYNFVDTLINNKLKKLRIAPSEVCSDEVFLRRAFLDIVGVMPEVEDYNKFMADKDPKKRDNLVDELLSRKEFVELWVMKWAELLQIRTSRQISKKAMLLYYNWLQDKIANNVPTDKMVQELLGSSGGIFSNAATNYYQNETNTLKVSENVAQVFMGMRIQCSQCHNHPFDRWTMDDYYSFAAFFSQIGRKRGEDPRETIVFNRGSGEVTNPVTKKRMAPKFLGGIVPDVKGKDRRVVLSEWLASPENPYFATNLANIVWAHFFGPGIIQEVDDVRVSNPAVNPELIEKLGKKFTEYNYDFKKLVRDICTSRTYQLATQTNDSNKSDNKNFSHGSIRRIRAEVLLDCLTQVTDTKNKFPGLPLGARAVQLADGQTGTFFLTTFGRAKRATVCSCEVKMEPTLSQALHLMNGETTTTKIQQGKFVATRLAEKKTPQEIITELYIRCLSRKPTAEELKQLEGHLSAEGANVQQVLEDIFWALLNSREFLFNH